MTSRGNWQGMWTIALLNWPFYMAAAVLWIASACGIAMAEEPAVRMTCGLTLIGSTYFPVISLAVSHLIYDRSDLYRWTWLERALHGTAINKAVLCHCGFDEVSAGLRCRLNDCRWVILDHYNEGLMTEPSIRRARKRFPPTTETVSSPFNQWPIGDSSADVILGLLAIHELRDERDRDAWFLEASRCIRTGGRIVIAEHVRDLANFLAFGPGFLHFHSRKSWQENWKSGGLKLVDEFRVSPWVRIFVLSKT